MVLQEGIADLVVEYLNKIGFKARKRAVDEDKQVYYEVVIDGFDKEKIMVAPRKLPNDYLIEIEPNQFKVNPKYKRTLYSPYDQSKW